MQEAEELQREMRALEEERAALLRDVQLREGLEQQYAKRGTLQVGWWCTGQRRLHRLCCAVAVAMWTFCVWP